MNADTIDLVNTLRTAHPRISEEVALKVAESVKPIANLGLGVYNAKRGVTLLLKSAGVPENKIVSLIEKALEFLGNVDFTTNQQDFATVFGFAFKEFSRTNYTKIYRSLTGKKMDTVWEIICACPADIWTNLFNTPLT